MDPAFPSWAEADDEPLSVAGLSKDKPKKPRHRHTAVQLAALNELYDKDEHPSLDDRTALAERLGMQTKTVNAWFQNKRASNKKRHKAVAPPSPSELPPLAAVLAGNTTSSPPHNFAETIGHDLPPSSSPPRRSHLRGSPYAPISDMLTQQQQTAFYAGNPEHRHIYESTGIDLHPRPRMRARPSSHQTDELRKAYARNPHPSKEEREVLCEEIGMRYQSVTNWFQNQRSLAKRRQEEEAGGSQGSKHTTRSHSQSRTFPPATEHPSLPFSLSAILNRETRSPSVEPSNDSVSSRASPYPVMPVQRPRRSRPEPHQLDALRNLYRQTATPSIEERAALALEVGMDLTKVTNWFRNLRQTTRKRGHKRSDDGDSDSIQLYSAPVSRGITPSFGSSSVGEHDRDHDMDTEMDEGEDIPMNYAHSDAGTDDDYQEAVTPPPDASPSPPPSYAPTPRLPVPERVVVNIDPGTYAEKKPGRLSGVRVEDALLLLSFHQHIQHISA